jgi:hypothetical protein
MILLTRLPFLALFRARVRLWTCIEEELREMIAEADEDGDGVVGPHDILRILTENAGATDGRGAGGRSDK